MHRTRPLFVSTYPPEVCGPATYTKELVDAVDLAAGAAVSSLAVIQKTDAHDYADRRVVHSINNGRPNAYRVAAEFANEGTCNVVSLQHAFGLYPDAWGGRVLDFARNCHKPIITTLHTLMAEPGAQPRRIIQTLASLSQGIVVMTEAAEQLLASAYHVAGPRVQVIPHGEPAEPFKRDDGHKKPRLGLSEGPMCWKNVGRKYLEFFCRAARAEDSSLDPLYQGGFIKASGKRHPEAVLQGGG